MTDTKLMIATSSAGLLVPRSLEEALAIGECYIKSKMVPKWYLTAEAVVVGMQYALELGLKPLSALRQIAVVHGVPSLFGDLPLALCRGSGLLERFQETFLDRSGKPINMGNKNLGSEVYAAVCIVRRRGDGNEVEAFFTMDDAIRAKLTGNGDASAWAKYPKRMLRYRARSQALKETFPDVLNGLAIGEYDGNTILEDVITIDVEASNSGGGQSMSEKLKQRKAEAETIDAEVSGG